MADEAAETVSPAGFEEWWAIQVHLRVPMPTTQQYIIARAAWEASLIRAATICATEEQAYEDLIASDAPPSGRDAFNRRVQARSTANAIGNAICGLDQPNTSAKHVVEEPACELKLREALAAWTKTHGATDWSCGCNLCIKSRAALSSSPTP